MFHRREFLQVATAAAVTAGGINRMSLQAQGTGASAIRRLSIDPLTGGARGVSVGPVPLLHTPQVYAWDDSGHVAAGGRADEQVTLAWQRLSEALKQGGSSVNEIARLHVYATSSQVVSRAKSFVDQQLDEKSRPAITFVTGGLAEKNAVVAFDAVAVSRTTTDSPAPRGLIAANAAWGRSAALQGILPPGRKLYISGQAEKGDSLRACTRATMDSLRRTLEMLNLSMEHVVQVKSFVTPITGKADVEDEIAKFFPADRVPPLVYVEWKSTLPIEIELIATVPGDKSKPATRESVEYHTPQWLPASPIFSRTAIINGANTIYTGGLCGQPGSGEAQVRDIFAQLQEITKELGSDLKHLAKATYYVANDETSGKLNAVRPEFYDPKRPPAASKAMVAGTGFDDRGITLDMIASPLK
jgi:enamine deaminase RidA (YjgF/YER057c/UK114 family)